MLHLQIKRLTMTQPDKKGALEVSEHFGVPVYTVDIRGFEERKQSLIDYVLDLKSKDSGVSRSNVGGWHSLENLHTHKNTDIQWLIAKLTKITQGASQHFFGDGRPGQSELRTCWVNISASGSWNAPHQHLPADWSGVFYLDAESSEPPGENGIASGDLMFFDPVPMGRRFNRPATISYRPKNGRVVLFPAYAVHMVAPHFEDKDRISIAFNVFWKSSKK